MRKSSWLILISLLLLLPGQLFSLGLGDIDVRSALNQPLNAQIQLISTRADEIEEMNVSLAPVEVFDRVGVPRPYFLTQLKFQPVVLPNGSTAIRVTSKDPVREPFLTFLVEVVWPNGRLLREYTVLLDPPEFAQQSAPPVEQPVTQIPPAQPEVEQQQMAAPAATTASITPDVSEQDDLAEIRARMDRELGIDHSEPVEPFEEEVEETMMVEAEEEIVEEEPTAEELEQAVAEETEEMMAEEEVIEDTVTIPEATEVAEAEESSSMEMVDPEEEDIEVLRARMDEALGVDHSEPVVRDEADYEEDTVMMAEVEDGYVTKEGDTLSDIAKPLSQSSETSLNQMMIAIQQANPDAFIQDNVNLLKTGAVLRLPEEGSAQNISIADAQAQVTQQNALWREYRGTITEKMMATNVDAPDQVTESTTKLAMDAEKALQESKPDSAPKQELNILASEEATAETTATQVAGGEEVQKLQKELSLTKERMLSRDKENEELKNRLDALESMLEKKEKIINIQNDQLKELQEQLSTEEDKAAAAEKKLQEAATAAEEKASEVVAKAEPEAIKKPQVEALPDFDSLPPIEVEEEVAKPKLEPLPDWDSLPEIEITEEEAAPTEEQPTEVAEKPAEVKPQEPAKPAEVKPPAQPVAAEEGGIMGTLAGIAETVKQHWTKIGGAIFALLAVLLGLKAWRQKRSVKTIESIGLGDIPMDSVDDDSFDDILDETIVTPQSSSQTTADVDEQVFAEAADVDADADDMDTEGDEPDDIIEEADVYISYGLHQQAQDLLNDAIAKEPGRQDFKVKLAEVYYSQKDAAGFENYAESVKDTLGESSSEWNSIVEMGKEVAASSALFGGSGAAAAPAADTSMADEDLEDTVLDNKPEEDKSLDFDIDVPDIANDSMDDDPVASKIMEASETSDILNFEVDDLADELADQSEIDTAIGAEETGLHDATGLSEAKEDLGDLTEELDSIGMDTTMNDLSPIEINEDELEEDLGDTIAATADDLGMEADTALTPEDPEATAAYQSALTENEDTEQFDISNVDTEFLDPAEATIAQTATDLEELGPPSLIEEVGTKLDLAKAFVDMGDSDAAKETLLEVINEGDESQIQAAKDLMEKLGG